MVVNPSPPASLSKDVQCPCCYETPLLGTAATFALVDQNDLRIQMLRQGDGRSFARIEALGEIRCHGHDFDHNKP